MDRSFVAQLDNYRITTAEILYWMPDHKHVLQSFVWQNLDLAPRFPALTNSSISGIAISTARSIA